MAKKIDTVARFFRRFVSFSTEWKDYEAVVTSDFTRTEMPSPLHPQGVTCSAAELLQQVGESRKLLSAQHFEIRNHLETDIQIAVEVVWTGLLAADSAAAKKGKNIKSSMSMFFEFKGDKILSQRIYDSHQPTPG